MRLGTFEVVSGKLAVSDPCYTTDVWCRGELNNVRNGTWRAEIEESDHDYGRVAKLFAVHTDHERWVDSQHTADFEVGVDSGQAGIFDAQHYRDDKVFAGQVSDFSRQWKNDDNSSGEHWYGFCCDITLGEDQGGVIPYGVVSRSGWGDGGYECRYGMTAQGEIVWVEIIFIYDDYDEEDEEDDWYCENCGEDHDCCECDFA